MLIVSCWAVLVAATPDAGAAEARARACVELGWHDRLAEDAGWRCEPWQVREPDDKPVARFTPDGGRFETGTPNRAMAWTRTTNPIWVGAFPFLEVDYEVVGAAEDNDDRILRLSDGSTGPVTPGALNPENPLASGAEATLGPATPGRHHLIVDVRELFRSDRVAEITLSLHGGPDRAKLTVRRIAFWASDPRTAPAASTQPSSRLLSDAAGASSDDRASDWQGVSLPLEHAIPADWLGRAFGSSASWPADGRCQRAAISFRLADASHAALTTGVMETDAIELAGEWRGSELALLLATRTFGSERAWYGGQSAPPRGPITSPHQLLVRLEYADGTKRSHFPWSVVRKDWSVDRMPEPYVVPLDPQRRLARITVEDQMTYGQVFLLAASVNRSSRPIHAVAPADDAAPMPREPVRPASSPTRWSNENGQLTVENNWIELRADVSRGFDVRFLRLVPLDRAIVEPASASPLLECLNEEGQRLDLSLREEEATDAADVTAMAFVWTAGDASLGHTVALNLVVGDDGRMGLMPAAVNQSDTPWKLAIHCPQLRACRIADSMADAWYLLGTRTALLNNKPVAVAESYGGAFPLQVIDLFAKPGGGLGLFVMDAKFTPKSFRFKQTPDGTDVSVRFPGIEVPPRGRVRLPTTILLPHLGDWHETYADYRKWSRALPAATHSDRLGDLFYCRRDYPLGGTGYLFDLRQKRYTPDDLIAESLRGFGGIDMIDISGWAYNEALGRVGEYRTNDLGGLEELRRAVDVAHQRGAKLGLYFEGYLIDRRCALAREALPAWQLVGKDGKPKWWSGSDKEFFACPGVARWREALADAMADVAARTGADAVYVDEFGTAGPDKTCWSPDHGHPVPSNPLLEEGRMLETVRAALRKRSLQTALYIEFVPADAQMGLIDAAFDYGMAMPRPGAHATKLPLSRFVFPEVVPVEFVSHGIRPVPAEEDDLHRSLFHGVAIWLKGRGDSWYSPGFRETAKRAYPILHDHADAFRSPDCEPLVPTLRADLYANRFATPAKTIITLYNARHSDISGDLICTKAPEGRQVLDLWNDRRADIRPEGDRIIIRGSIDPHAAGAFLLAPPAAPTR